MKIPPVKGTRDFYPQEMAVRNWIIDGWKRVSLRNGFEEYDGPIFEYLDMYRIKSGDEIVEQLFSFKDRGDRNLALRPEITPTLARMANQKINTLPLPIKWFSVPRLFRAERPQKGRLREFFQWNIDIIGIEGPLADAEVIFCALDYLRGIGLTPDDIEVRMSSRKLLASVLEKIGVAEKRLEVLYPVLDKKEKVPAGEFKQMLSQKVADGKIAEKIVEFMGIKAVSDIKNIIEPDDKVNAAIDRIVVLFDWLKRMGVVEYCQFDPGIVRGLAYYTDSVYEIYDKRGELRAIGGGGRYDDLLKQFGGPAIPATGFGMGDCVLGVMLEERGLLKPAPAELDYFIACVELEQTQQDAVKIAAELRTRGYSAEFGYKSASLSRQLKQASAKNAKKCIILGDEFKNNELVVKDMVTSKQKRIKLDAFFAELGTLSTAENAESAEK
ncbi:MAG: histidine--tRNA ligase [Phycisphaerae bacterium]|nr:histidine--tRNA ligase [Phycisphaerae bacterium]